MVISGYIWLYGYEYSEYYDDTTADDSIMSGQDKLREDDDAIYRAFDDDAARKPLVFKTDRNDEILFSDETEVGESRASSGTGCSSHRCSIGTLSTLAGCSTYSFN